MRQNLGPPSHVLQESPPPTGPGPLAQSQVVH